MSRASGDRAGESVELRHNVRVASAHGGERLIEAGPFPLGAGHAVVDVDAIGGDAERPERLALGGEVLFVG